MGLISASRLSSPSVVIFTASSSCDAADDFLSNNGGLNFSLSKISSITWSTSTLFKVPIQTHLKTLNLNKHKQTNLHGYGKVLDSPSIFIGISSVFS